MGLRALEHRLRGACDFQTFRPEQRSLALRKRRVLTSNSPPGYHVSDYSPRRQSGDPLDQQWRADWRERASSELSGLVAVAVAAEVEPGREVRPDTAVPDSGTTD
jgi:hypothetical protein